MMASDTFHNSAHPSGDKGAGATQEDFRDPVCGMVVNPATAPATAVHEGRPYYFCSPSCLRQFQADPGRYVAEAGHAQEQQGPAEAAAAVTDPVCGMTLDPAHAAGSAEHSGRTYYFCSTHCLDRFRTDPARYATPPTPSPAPAPPPSGQTYICPMHPELRQQGPGTCPKCGMALEPVEAAAGTKIEYTCPMHPEVVSDHPGTCPKCGMALEPRTVTA